MVQYAKGKGVEYARGFVIKYGQGHKQISQIFDSRDLAKQVMSDYDALYKAKGSKPKVVKWVYEKPQPIGEDEKKRMQAFSTGMNKALRELV